MTHIEDVLGYSGNYYPEPCEACGQYNCTCDDISPCVRCGEYVMSTVSATQTDEGWIHNRCLATKKEEAA